MSLNRQHLSDIYRPAGPKQIITGQAWSSGGSATLTQLVDLSLPIRGLRIVFKGRCVIGTAGFTSANPEGFLNLLSSIIIQGTNARQQGNLTLWNIDLASLWVMQSLFAYRGAAFYSINSGSGEVELAPPTMPMPSTYAPITATGTYDFRIVLDIPFHPFQSNGFGKEPLTVPQFLVRNEEWKDSLQIVLGYGAQAGGGASGVLGTSAGTTTIAFSSYGSGSGTPTIDLYSLPVLMGTTLKDQILPGVISRISTPITGAMQNAGVGVPLLNLQKQPTPRVFFKQGVSTVSPAFSSLTDTNVTALGIQLGQNRNVRNVLDLFTHKLHQADVYSRDLIQGYTMFDFMDQGNPDSAYPGQDVGDGATLQVTGNVTGVANGLGLLVQEQVLQQPAGALMNF
jgi:hypothetical protein